MLVLEELERAKARGAKIYAELAGLRRLLGRAAHHRARPDRRAPGARDADGARRRGHRRRPRSTTSTRTARRRRSATRARRACSRYALGEENARKTPISVDEGRDRPLPRRRRRGRGDLLVLAIRTSMLPPTINYEIPGSRVRPRLHPERGAPRPTCKRRDVELVRLRRPQRLDRPQALRGLAAVADRWRWATFDCYGTLIDWNGGIRRELAGVFGDGARPRVARAATTRSSRGSSATEPALALPRGDGRALAELGAPAGRASDALADARCPPGQPFPEVPAALEEARAARLAARDPLEHRPRLHRGVASARSACRSTRRSSRSEVGSYKPALGHWRAFEAQTDADLPDVHVAASHFHDIVPGEQASACRRSGSTGLAESRRSARDARDRGVSRRSRTCSTSSSGVTQLDSRRATERGSRRRSPTSATPTNARFSRAGASSARTTSWLFWRRESEDGWSRRGHARRHGLPRRDAAPAGTETATSIRTPSAAASARRSSSGSRSGARAGAPRRRASRTLARDERAAVPPPQPGLRADPELLPDGDRAGRATRAAGWPDGFAVAPLAPARNGDLYEVLEDAFLDHWGHTPRTFDEWSKHRMSSSRGAVVPRPHDGVAAAGAFCSASFRHGLGGRPRHAPRLPPSGSRPRRCSAIPSASSMRRGARQIGLGVDAENPTGATRLYERVGMRVASAADLYAKHL